MSTWVKIESSQVSIKIELDSIRNSTRNLTRHHVIVKSLTRIRLNSTRLDFNPG